MKYITYKIKFENGYGYSPSSSETLTITPAEFWLEENENIFVLAYVNGKLDIEQFSEYDLQELSQNQALDFVQKINPDAYLDSNGFFVSPNSSLPVLDS